MEDSVLQRFREFIEKNRMSVTSLGKKIGVPQATLNSQIRGDRALSLLTISALLDYFPDVSAEWLLRGKGEMLLTGSAPVVSEAQNAIVGNHNTGNNAGGLSEEFVKSVLDEKDKQINQFLQIVSNLSK